jgi:riboflavin biosynthesis pyrimidine reductase
VVALVNAWMRSWLPWQWFGSPMWAELVHAGMVDELHLLVAPVALANGPARQRFGPRAAPRLLDVRCCEGRTT